VIAFLLLLRNVLTSPRDLLSVVLIISFYQNHISLNYVDPVTLRLLGSIPLIQDMCHDPDPDYHADRASDTALGRDAGRDGADGAEAEAAGTTLFRQGSCILARRPSPLFLFLQLKILSLECIQLYSVAGRDS
jgi:hypothetical protein